MPNGKRYVPDAVDERNKVCYDFYGDWWHGNLEIYSPNGINTCSGKTFGELNKKTAKRQLAIEKAGYIVIAVWEKDYDRIIKK